MENYTGIAFTSDAITLSNFQVNSGSRILTNLDKIDYPFQYEENIFFLEENLIRLANLILNKFESLHLEPKSISISIESNLALIKRIELPIGLDEKEESKHVEWDLTNSLISSIENYVYLKTNNFYNRDSFKEVLVIALRKDIVDFFKSLVDILKVKLNNLSTNNLATELCFQNTKIDDTKGINLLFRLNKDRFESICLYDHKLYFSEYEKIKPISSRTKEEILLEKITSQTKKIENHFDQLFNTTPKIDNLFLYGQDINEPFVSLISKNISTKISIFNPNKNIRIADNLADKNMNDYEMAEYVESIGITLDSD